MALSEDDLDDFDAITERLGQAIHQGEQALFDEALAEQTAAQLLEAVAEGFAGEVKGLTITKANSKLVAQLENNIFEFAGHKTFNQIQNMKDLLVDEAGNLRTLQEYTNQVRALNNQYNRSMIRAEFTHAVNGSRNAAEFEDALKNKDDIDLIYDAVDDGQTTEICSTLDGTVAPVDDELWDRYTPDNHWNCRSRIRQVRKGTTGKQLDRRTIPGQDEVFKNNPAKSGVLFKEDHPFFKTASSDDSAAIDQGVQSLKNKRDASQ